MTLIIITIIITAIISITAFQNKEVMRKLQLNPYNIVHKKEWHRVITHAFIHADWMHLIFNMFVLFSLGSTVENILNQLEAESYIKSAPFTYILLYFGGIIFSSLTTVKQYKDDALYNAVGASGAVSAIVFVFIFFMPLEKLYLFMLPIPIPGFIFGLLYLGFSAYMSKKGKDNINHQAHFMGALFGLIFPLFIDIKLFMIFINQLFGS